MSEPEKSTSLDVLGIKPIAEAIDKTTTALIAGAAAVLSRVCLPAAEELGLGFKDRMSHWRAQQLAKLARRVETKLSDHEIPNSHHAHPRLMHAVIENGSWNDGDVIQDMWAGILVSGCTEDGRDDSNIIFASLLGQISNVEAHILNAACTTCKMRLVSTGLVVAQYGPTQVSTVKLTIDQLREITKEGDIHRLDRECDHLVAIGLLDQGSGFNVSSKELVASAMPSALGIQLYVRCQGFRGSPAQFFGLRCDDPATSEA